MMHFDIDICDLAIENGFSEKEADALYFLNEISDEEKQPFLNELEKAIGRYKLDKRDWNEFKITEQYKDLERLLKRYDKEYNLKVKSAISFLKKLGVENLSSILDDLEELKLPDSYEFMMIGEFSLSMRANIRQELPKEILFQIAQWKLERKNWRKAMRGNHPEQPNKDRIEQTLIDKYKEHFKNPIGAKAANFLKTFN